MTREPSGQPIVTNAYLFGNGMVMAFDGGGKQVPEYQGTKEEVVPKLRRDFPRLVIKGLDDGPALSFRG
jgi:hypothetical protein